MWCTGPVPTTRRRHRMSRSRLASCVLAAAALLVPLLNASPASAAPLPLPAAFDLSRYTPVDPTPFRSLAYDDNGRSFFTTGRWNCQIGPTFRSVGCQGRPATAPPGVQGAAITADAQGPWWVPKPDLLTGTSYRFGSTSGFRPPRLSVGARVTIAGVTCTVPSATQVACRTGNRALIFSPGFHKFYYPAGDAAHNGNPAPRYLPASLQASSQLPLVPPPPS